MQWSLGVKREFLFYYRHTLRKLNESSQKCINTLKFSSAIEIIVNTTTFCKENKGKYLVHSIHCNYCATILNFSNLQRIANPNVSSISITILRK